jgi:hypothetical protein
MCVRNGRVEGLGGSLSRVVEITSFPSHMPNLPREAAMRGFWAALVHNQLAREYEFYYQRGWGLMGKAQYAGFGAGFLVAVR